jgi:hypothetical protein
MDRAKVDGLMGSVIGGARGHFEDSAPRPPNRLTPFSFKA